MRAVTQEQETRRKVGLAWRQRGFRDGNLGRPQATRGADIPDEQWSYYFSGWRAGCKERERRMEISRTHTEG